MDDIAVLATSFLFGVVRDHPFAHGDKGTAFTAAIGFLGLNDWAFALVDDINCAAHIINVIKGEATEQSFTPARCSRPWRHITTNGDRTRSSAGWRRRPTRKALAGNAERPAALVEGCAGRPIANPTDLYGLSLWRDEKRGHVRPRRRRSLCIIIMHQVC
ncbi:hypothetical protein RSD66_03965 [Brevundimonas sp. S1H14]